MFPRFTFVLEFLGLKDEYSETDLEEALIRHLETFLLELGGDCHDNLNRLA
jgi:predicted nuclease of restriction endonuclease-like (RecB) superfamily